MTTTVSTRFATTALAAAAIGFGALMTIGAPAAHASEKSDCDAKGGTYTETQVTWNGKTGTTYRCCVKDTATNTTTCTSTTVTKAVRIPDTVRPGVIDTAETIEPAAPSQRVPLEVLNADGQIQQTP
jgi:hypothetical protein